MNSLINLLGKDEQQTYKLTTSPSSLMKMVSSLHPPNSSVKLQYVPTTLSRGIMPSSRQQATNSTMALRITKSSDSPSKLWNTTTLKVTQSKLISTASLMISHTSTSNMSYLNHTLPYSSSSMFSSQSIKVQSIHSHSFILPSSPNPATASISASHYTLSVSPSSSSPYTKNTFFSEIPVSTTKSLQTTATPEEYIIGKIHFTEESFSSELNDQDSQKFKDKAKEVEEWLNSLFKNNNLEFLKVEVIGFTKGSVVVEFFVTVVKTLNYKPQNITEALREAKTTGGPSSEPFQIYEEDFSQKYEKPTPRPTSPNEAELGLQKNDDDDDSSLIVAIVMCIVLLIGTVLVVYYIGKKRNWFNRSRRKVIPDE